MPSLVGGTLLRFRAATARLMASMFKVSGLLDATVNTGTESAQVPRIAVLRKFRLVNIDMLSSFSVDHSCLRIIKHPEPCDQDG